MKQRQGFSPLEIHLGHTVGETTAHLTRSFFYTDEYGIKHTAPAKMLTDGLSIPKFLWRIFGAPFASKWLASGIIHDSGCIEAHRMNDEFGDYDGAVKYRLKYDKLFLEMLRFQGCSRSRSWFLYRGVRIGARSIKKATTRPKS